MNLLFPKVTLKRFLSLLLLIGGLSTATSAQPLDPNNRLSIGDALIYEGNSTYRDLAFPVSLPAALPYDVSASYLTKPITALAGSDYTPQLAGQVVLKAGQTRVNIVVRVTGDTIEERDETFLVQLGAPKRALISDSDGIGSIKDDDYGGEVSIADVSLAEGNEGQKLARANVSLSPAPLHDIEIRYEAKDDSAKATRRDYLPTRGSLVFRPGRTVLSVEVPVLSDRDFETDEKFFVKIVVSPYNPVLNIIKNIGVVTLRNDDIAPPAPTSPSASIE